MEVVLPKPKNSNLLTLAVLSLLDERPMHPYELSTLMKARGITYSIKLNTGNLYATMASLVSEGLALAMDVEREGRLPERTIYQLTPQGRHACEELLRNILGAPEKEYPRFVAGLSFLAHLSPEEVGTLLEARLKLQQSRAEAEQREYQGALASGVDPLYLAETSFSLALLAAEINWIGTFLKRLKSGELTVTVGDRSTWRSLGTQPQEEWR